MSNLNSLDKIIEQQARGCIEYENSIIQKYFDFKGLDINHLDNEELTRSEQKYINGDIEKLYYHNGQLFLKIYQKTKVNFDKAEARIKTRVETLWESK